MRRWYDNDNPSTPYQNFAYDELFRVDKVTDILSRVTAYQAGAIAGTEPWKFSQIVEPLANASTSIFDAHNNLIQAIDGVGDTTSNLYDNFNRLLQTAYPEGNYSTFTYDVRSNRLTTTEYPKPGSAEYIGQQTIITSTAYKEGPTVFNCSNSKTCNKPSSEKDARSYYTNYAWDSGTGLLTQVISGLNSSGACQVAGGLCPQSDFGHDICTVSGNTSVTLLTSKTDKINATASTETDYHYNSTNKCVLQAVTQDVGTGKLNLTTTLGFDAIGNLTSVDGPRTDVSDDSHFLWDPSRRLQMSIKPDPDGSGNQLRKAVQYLYDADGQLKETDRGTVTDTAGSNFSAHAIELVTYSSFGDRVEVVETAPGLTTPLNVTQYAYDSDERLACSVVRMNPASFASLPSACTLTTGYALDDRLTRLLYDGADRKRQETRGYGATGQQVYETLDYTPNGKQKAVADADAGLTYGLHNLNATVPSPHQTNYAYNGFDRLYTTTYSDGTQEQVPYQQNGGYDPAGNVLSRINRANQTITFTYDALDRILTKTVPAYGTTAADTLSWVYDALGEVTSLSDTAGHVLVSTYDAARRLKTATRTAPGLTGSQIVNAQYDADGHRTVLAWPDNYCVLTTYDATGTATLAKEGSYSGSTCTAGATLAGFDYDTLDHLADVYYGGTLAQASYTWQTNDDLLTLAHDFVSSTDVSFTDTYSPAHQIVDSVISNAAYAFVPGTFAATYATANALNQYPTITPSAGTARTMNYDADGNLASDGVFTFAYDPQNRLVSAAASGVSATYAYDPLGRRAAKTVNGTATFFLDDGDNEIGEYAASGTLLRRFVPGLAVDRPLAMIDYTLGNHPKTFLHQDKTGSVVAMSDTTGNVSEGPYTYDAFGTPPTAAGVPYKFDGMRYDAETGCYYDRARYYCPGIGRFLQTDPIGYADDVDWYNWVGNDPTDRDDPTGQCPECITALIGAGLGGAVGGGIEIATQLFSKGEVSDWGAVGTSALGGAVSGGVTGFTGCISCGNAAGGFVQSFADSLREDPHNVKAALLNGAIGGGVSLVAGKIPDAASKGSSGVSWIARNEKSANLTMGRIKKGLTNPANLALKTWGRLSLATTTQSVAPALFGTGMQNMITSQPNVQKLERQMSECSASNCQRQ